ncbi:cache domain-containing protein [Rhodoferax sp.]|uniref:sensor histidine kinase n=1 Tax=Rhodoferax sp. TaxID=50421 RepID=UPI002616D2B2|nr:cache domain-containing protein [Rhodoferax sp.]MDD2926238.1 cache domain-containing protein [Rhodoferax sp.]
MSTRWLRRRWQQLSVRHKLMVLSLLPLVVVLPLLMAALMLWGNAAFNQLLITKIHSDLAVASGYFSQVQAEIGASTQATAQSHALHQALVDADAAAVQQVLSRAQQAHQLDFVNLYSPQGILMAASWYQNNSSEVNSSLGSRSFSLVDLASEYNQLQRLDQAQLLSLAPHLAKRLHIALVPTHNAAATERTHEDRALLMRASFAVRADDGQLLGWLQAGTLLNQNLPFIDHINAIVYPEGSLPLGSKGTATLFLDDVRITTNVRLFQDQRAIGTRVSQAVRDTVLWQGQTWLDRAFVVNDWYVSAYEPLLNAQHERIGMLYVGYLETPFRHVKYGLLAMVIGIFGAAMLLAAWASLRWARSIFQPVECMNHTMQRVQDGDHTARVGVLTQHDELGALAGHLDQLLDVVDDKTATLQRWGQELDAKVAARTQELASSNQSLQQAQAQLVKSEKLAAIGQLTASVAHEINNPIAVLQGNLDLVRETLGAHAQSVSDELSLMDQQMDRMRLIVTQLLQYARPNDYAGYVVAVDVNETLENSLVLVAHLLDQSHIEVRRELHASQSVAINRQELQQVLINLMINAIQAMPKGGTLTLCSRDQPDSSGRAGVLLQVCDTGAGLSDDTKTRLFSPFFTTKNDGNGLGLWISVGLLERYGGTISADNRQELGDAANGAIFGVWLPCEQAHQDLTPAYQTLVPQPA